MDSTPGRLNQAQILLRRPGVYFGQCSEICGINHRFMPISVESTRMANFKKWLFCF
ncbi:Cytochrome c oxidase subunit 2 [Trachymyrmex zeteki]|uniref:cytochrome-c oxidase n=1 Tax=Mycetomoellerius zeteki TaxID=64791 RepID=A0A151WXU3_9HYME|nr:Cytochrome c oxidase subunit 2 [Trachymyrmex zeteki]